MSVKGLVFWIAVMTCALYVAAMAVSEKWSVLWVLSDGPGSRTPSFELCPQHLEVSWLVGEVITFGGPGPSAAGFYFNRSYRDREWGVRFLHPSSQNRLLMIPYWLAALVMGVVAFFTRPARRSSEGRCSCGYDLTGLTPTAPCPECGVTPPPSAPPAT